MNENVEHSEDNRNTSVQEIPIRENIFAAGPRFDGMARANPRGSNI